MIETSLPDAANSLLAHLRFAGHVVDSVGVTTDSLIVYTSSVRPAKWELSKFSYLWAFGQTWSVVEQAVKAVSA